MPKLVGAKIEIELEFKDAEYRRMAIRETRKQKLSKRTLLRLIDALRLSDDDIGEMRAALEAAEDGREK